MFRCSSLVLLAACGFNGKGVQPDTIDAAPSLDTPPSSDAAIDAPPPSIDGPPIVMIDAPVDAIARTCPAGYGAIAGAAGNYKLQAYDGTWWAHHADCNDDAQGTNLATHLAVIDDMTEASAFQTFLAANGTQTGGRYFLGMVQKRGATASTGWIDFSGRVLDGSALWFGGEPADGQDAVENGEENLGAMFVNKPYLADVRGSLLGFGICECDGIAIAADAITAIAADPNHP